MLVPQRLDGEKMDKILIKELLLYGALTGFMIVNHRVKIYKKAICLKRKKLEEEIVKKQSELKELTIAYDQITQPGNINKILQKIALKKR